jgi:hypothetical protein
MKSIDSKRCKSAASSGFVNSQSGRNGCSSPSLTRFSSVTSCAESEIAITASCHQHGYPSKQG